jgi:hypothetical protein
MGSDRVEVELGSEQGAPSLARAAMAPLLPSPEALLLASELVTHAVAKGAPPISLTVTGHDDALLIEVSDRRSGLHSPAEDPFVGRLLDRLSLDWGVRGVRDGMCAWALVARVLTPPHTLG